MSTTKKRKICALKKIENNKASNANDANRSVFDEEQLLIAMPSCHRILTGHRSETFLCAWNPVADYLASSSTNGIARIWNVHSSNCANYTEISSYNSEHMELHGQVPMNSVIICLDWDYEGKYLVTGSNVGYAQVWTLNGLSSSSLKKHKGPIFAIKWNKKGDRIVTAGDDHTTILWIPARGYYKIFSFHSQPVLDVAWKTETKFASCSADGYIYVWESTEYNPQNIFKGHCKEVRCIEWDVKGELLASCSDDTTVKIWSMKKDHHIISCKGHSKEVHTVKWSHNSPSTQKQYLFLVSASYDKTIRIWDWKTGSCVHILTEHTEAVYSIDVSPNGKLLVSSGFHEHVYVSDVETGKLRHCLELNGKILKVAWNSTGDKIAACSSNGIIFIIDVYEPQIIVFEKF